MSSSPDLIIYDYNTDQNRYELRLVEPTEQLRNLHVGSRCHQRSIAQVDNIVRQVVGDAESQALRCRVSRRKVQRS